VRLRVIPGLIAFCVSTVSFAQNPPPPPIIPAEEYRVRDAVESSFVNLATFPVRPMAFDAAGNLWAVNHLDSTITRFTGITTPSTTYPLPWNPAAVAFWPGLSTSTADDEMLVTCRGSWAVVELSVATGDILQVHQLRPVGTDSARQGQMAEPGDIIIVGNQALVTCGAADTVVQIDLSVNPRTTFVYDRDGTPPFPAFEAKAPLFLSKDSADNVYVAPLISGNNTVADRNESSAVNVQKPAPGHLGLPDSDLFQIDPVAHTLSVVAKNMGTILFAHGINPASNPPEMWMLNTDAFNARVNSEPQANGVFSQNRISIFKLIAGVTAMQPDRVLPLDQGAPTGGIAGMTAPLGQPFSLAFLNNPMSPQHGYAFICGLLTDDVLVLKSSGSFFAEWKIASGGAIPRQVLLDPTNTRLLVYCWGQNAIRIYDWAAGGTQTAQLSLGFDPTPASLKPGRALFFSGDNSRYGNLSCASCHIEGGSDLLTWNLSNLPQDDKGPMITQTLVGIQRMAPFHWRGERDLPDFLGAFKGLLGRINASTGLPEDLDAASFDQLQTYLFSLTNPANPNQSRKRVLDDNLPTPDVTGSAAAVNGQNVFNDIPVFANVTTTCASCHFMPLGTGGDIIDEFQGLTRARRAQMKPPPFHELFRREMGTGSYDFGLALPVDAPFLGSGFTHVGLDATLHHFVARITGTTPQDANDIAAFVHQFDQGLGQAAHYAFLLNSASSLIATTELKSYLLDQARGRAGDVQGSTSRRNCDIVVFGTVKNASGVAAKRRWYFDRDAVAGAGIFRCDDPTFTTSGQNPGERTIDNFLSNAATESNVFVGLPVGMGERFGVDYDLDGTYNAADIAPTDPSIPGPIGGTVTFLSTNPAALAQVLWKTSKSARIRFDTNLPTRFDVYVWPVGGTQPPTPQITTDVYSKEHTVLVGNLRPSTNHDAPSSISSPAYLQQTITYNTLINAIPRVGTAAMTSPTITTYGHKESTVFLADTSSVNTERQMRLLLDHVINGLSMAPITIAGSGNPGRSVRIGVAFKRGGSYTGNSFVRVPAPSRAIVARVFAQDTQTLAVRPLDQNQVGAIPGKSFQVDDVYIDHSSPTGTQLVVGAAPVTNAVGVFIVGENLTATTTGVTAMDVELLQPLGPNEKVIFGIEAAVEVTGTSWSGASMVTGAWPHRQLVIPTAYSSSGFTATEAWAQWSFPDTKEAGAQVRDP
jgi:hypothetical protein